MPATLVPLVVPRGLPAFRCPVTGIPVWDEDGLEEGAEQSPYIRFFIDWIGQIWVAPPSLFAGDVAAEQRALVASLQVFDEVDRAPTQDEQMKQVAENLSSSAVVFEILNSLNPHGHGGGEICYVCFDFDPEAKATTNAVKLALLDDVQ